MKPAFLIVDVQKQYTEMDLFKNTAQFAYEYINLVGKYFREANFPVIHVLHATADGGKGNPGYEVAGIIDQADTDLYVEKNHSNAFWETDLENILKDLDVDFVIVSGLAANYCALSTYLGSLERGFNTVFLHNGLMADSLETTRRIQNERNVISYPAVKYLIDSLKK